MTLLLFMFYISYRGFLICKKAPFKIKILTYIAVLCIIIRNIALIIMFITENLTYLYFLKPLIYLNFISMPIIVCIILCILARSSKINFSYLFIVFFASVAIYILFILKGQIYIILNMDFGYMVNMINAEQIKNIALAFYTLCCMWFIVLIKEKNSNKLLIVFSAIACVVSIAEILLNIISMEFIPNLLISNCLWLILLDYILYKIKRERHIN